MTNADPEIVGDRADIFVVEIERVHQLAVDVGLILVGGGVADADWRRAHVALPMIERFLGWKRLTVNGENGRELLRRCGMLGDVVLQPVHEAGGFAR